MSRSVGGSRRHVRCEIQVQAEAEVLQRRDAGAGRMTFHIFGVLSEFEAA